MAKAPPSLEEVVGLAKQLSPADQLCVVERLVVDLGAKIELSKKKPLRSLYGALAHLGPAPSAEDRRGAPRDVEEVPARRCVVIVAIADTHAAIWYVFADFRLSRKARDFIDQAAGDVMKVGVSAITLAEAMYLSEKGKVPAETVEVLIGMLREPEAVLEEIPLSGEIVEDMRQVDRAQVPDLPDRLIAATAIHFNVAVISRDRKIQAANLETVW